MRTAPSARSARPFLVLAAALISQLSAGMLYWWPALTPGLQHHLRLTAPEATALVATANSGSALGILGGLFHSRAGSRWTAAAGLAGCAASYLALAALVHAPPPPAPRAVFAVCCALALAVNIFSYMVYSSAMAAAAALFPRRFRGRVVGLCASMYGAAAGVAGAVQAAFFPSLADTFSLLVYAAAFAAIGLVLALLSYPDKETFRVDPPDQAPPEYGAVQEAEDPPAEWSGDDSLRAISGSVEASLVRAYYVAWALVGSLIASAVAEVFDLPHLAQMTCAVAVVAAMLSFSLLPLRSSLIVEVQEGSSGALTPVVEPLPPFASVAFEPRYLYLCLGFLVLVGGGGVALLVQAPLLMKSVLYAGADPATTFYDDEKVSRAVRIVVVIFSACNVTARLGIGAIMDWGDDAVERHLWKFDVMLNDSYVMGLALLGIAFARSSVIYIPVALVGLCYGTWFSTSPALTTLWFGVRSFPRNFALLGALVTVASATMASTIPSALRSAFGSWVNLSVAGSESAEVEHVCNGIWCSLPIFCLLAALQSVMYGLGRNLRPYVESKAEARGY